VRAGRLEGISRRVEESDAGLVGLAGVRTLQAMLQQGPSGKGALECGVGNGVRSVKSKPNRRCRLSEKTGRPCEMRCEHRL
jgi:hypothetical protein